MKLKEFWQLLVYSVKSFFEDTVSLVASIKSPKTWNYIIFATFLAAVYYKKYMWMVSLIPLFILIKIIRDKKEGTYRKEAFDRDIMKGVDSDLVKARYNEYIMSCAYKKVVPYTFEEWKEDKKRVTTDSIQK